MLEPIRCRKEIPFFYDKSHSEFQRDPYERYNPTVLRQSMLHLADHLWHCYPFQAVKDYISSHWPLESPRNILELGCGVGRMIGDTAHQYPDSNCWGIDYSYQMLKRAKEVWLDDKELELDFSNQGFNEKINIECVSLRNLKLGLAKCEALPFEDSSQDLIYSSFLFDRLEDPIQGLMEMKRVLSDKGRIIIVSPLNFKTVDHWKHYYPIFNLKTQLLNIGFEILSWQDDIKVSEPLDARGNYIGWNCIATVLMSESRL